MRFKISLDLQDEKRISGNDLFVLLEYIMLYGSISRAAARAGVSYRYAWGLLQEAERGLNLTLLEKQAGGYAGGGAVLTLEGKEILREYKEFKGRVDRELADFLRRTGSIQYEPDVQRDEEGGRNFLLLASTMEPVETGLLDALEVAFFQEKGIFVRHLAAGSGRALEIARGGRVDMVLSHAPELESEFMDHGWGAYQFPIMANDFALVGPASDPADIGSMKEGFRDIGEVFQRIALRGVPFVTRGDDSGTYLRERKIWSKAKIIPDGDWYVQYPGVAGNLGALRFARSKKAYMLTDMASYFLSHEENDCRLFFDGGDVGEDFTNVFVLTLVNPEKVASSNLQDAYVFARWLLKDKGKKIIADFGRSDFDRPLFSLVDN